MTKSTLRLRIATAIALLCASMLAASALAAERPENKWRIQCSEGARSDGTITFRVVSLGMAPIEVPVPIERGTGENGVARRIRDELRDALPADDFQVETDDGEDVLVKKHHGESDFVLQLVHNDVKSVRINLDRE